MASLVESELTDSNLTDAGLKHLEASKSLERLIVPGAQVTDMGLNSFARLSRSAMSLISSPPMKPLIYLLLSYSFIAQAASPDGVKRLADLRKAYEAAAQRPVDVAASSAIKALNVKYGQALDRFISNAMQAGKLEEAITLRDEKARSWMASRCPRADADAPEVLKAMRGTYRTQLASIEAAREKQLDR